MCIFKISHPFSYGPEMKINRDLFCISLTYSYLCPQKENKRDENRR